MKTEKKYELLSKIENRFYISLFVVPLFLVVTISILDAKGLNDLANRIITILLYSFICILMGIFATIKIKERLWKDLCNEKIYEERRKERELMKREFEERLRDSKGRFVSKKPMRKRDAKGRFVKDENI